MNWLAIAIGIGVGALFAAAFTNFTLGVLALLVFAVSGFFGWAAWAMFRLSKLSSRQGAAGWPPPAPLTDQATAVGPVDQWNPAARPPDRAQRWWASMRQRGHVRRPTRPSAWPPPPPSSRVGGD